MVLKLVAQPTEVSDEELLLAVRSRDERAIATLYRRYAPYVAGVAFRMLGSHDEVDDVVQQVFYETVGAADRIEFIRGWLYRLTTRQVARRLRKRWRKKRLQSAIEWLAPRTSDPGAIGDLNDLYRALDSMTPELRLPWSLHHIEGRTIPETAEHCGVSPATVKRRIARAEDRMAKRWSK